MDFGLIEREDKEIDMDEWLSFIQKTDYLETMESKEGINPFTGEKVMFHREHSAYYLSGIERVGNIALEQGNLLTTGVPRGVCEEIANYFNAGVSEDDRS